ncbi:MAG TPA: hypothetical protein VJ904_00820, partial [Tichowtungia sp.]|nr:hypothetical protein [Tichowtungia sp.]
MKKIILAAMISCLFYSMTAAQVTELESWSLAQGAAVSQDRRVTDPETGITIPYRLFMPDNFDPTKKYPVVLCLHGNGSRGTNNWHNLWYSDWMQPAVQDVYPSIIIVPHGDAGWVDGSFSGWDLDSVGTNYYMVPVQHLMERFYEKDFVDRGRFYVWGASKGGMGTWWFTLVNNDIIAASLPMEG